MLSVKQGRWVKVAKNSNVRGQHWFITDLQYNDLQKKLKIAGFPSYFVVDSKGKIYRNFSLWDEEVFLQRVLGIVSK